MYICEKINLDKLEKCISEYPDINLQKIKDLYKPVKKGSNCGVHVVKLNFNGFGRPYAKDNVTLATIKSEIRKKISVPCYDIDIVNSQPTIIRNICKKWNIRCPYLTKYINNRDNWLKNTTKENIIAVLNGRNVGENDYLYDLYLEITTITESLSKLIEYKKIKTYSQTKQTDLNPKNILHFIYTDLENKITKESIDSLINKYGMDIHINCYIYDGFLIQLSKNIYINDIINFLNTLHNDIIYTIKPFNETETFEEEKIEEISFKKEFEKTHCKIINKSFFIKRNQNENIYFNENKLITSYKHLPNKFINEWLKDPEIRVYEDIGIYPNPLKCPDDHYNVWIPFEMENDTPFIYSQESVNIFLKHLLILCGNENEIFEYFLKWNAQMIQYPEVKTIVPTLISNEGAGKGSYLLLMKKLLGSSKVFETSNPNRDVWGSFNGMMCNCFLVNCNELSKKDSQEAQGRIKTLITDTSLTINIKGVPQFEITSYHRFINTTNKKDPINTSADDRRNFIIRCSDELIGNKEYFEKYYQILENYDSLKSIYTYLKNIPDMKSFNKLKIPLSEHSVILKEQNKPIELQFMEWLVFQKFEKDIVKCKPPEIMEWFQEFKMTNNITDYNINSIKLGVRIALLNLKGIEKLYDNKGTIYHINTIELKTNFNYFKK